MNEGRREREVQCYASDNEGKKALMIIVSHEDGSSNCVKLTSPEFEEVLRTARDYGYLRTTPTVVKEEVTPPTPDKDVIAEVEDYKQNYPLPLNETDTENLKDSLRGEREHLEKLLSHARQLEKDLTRDADLYEKSLSGYASACDELVAATQRIAELEAEKEHLRIFANQMSSSLIQLKTRDAALTADYNTYKAELFAAWEVIGMKPEQVTTELPAMILQLKQERDEARIDSHVKSEEVTKLFKELCDWKAKLDGAVRCILWKEDISKDDFMIKADSLPEKEKLKTLWRRHLLILPADEQVGKEGGE